MEYTLGTFFTGLVIFIIGALIFIFYRPISENIAHGVSSYDKIKLVGIITIGVGFLVMVGLHLVILNFLVKSLIPQ